MNAYNPKSARLDIRYRLACHLWWLVNATLFRFSPFFCYGWRRFLLRSFGAKIAVSATIGRTAVIDAPWNLVMGERSMICKNAWVSCHASVVIGNQSIVGEYARILTGSHRTDSTNYEGIASGVTIGADCWIASCAIVSSGGYSELKIGDGAIVSAGAVVYSDVREKGIAIGNPAHCVLDRVLPSNQINLKSPFP